MMYINQRQRNVAQLVARLVWDQNVAGSSPVVPTPGRLAQLGEHLVYTQVVGGSIPSSPTKHFNQFEVFFYGGIAQQVEHTAHIRQVIGSNPIAAKSRLFNTNSLFCFYCYSSKKRGT